MYVPNRIKIKGFEHLVVSLLLDFLLRLSPNLGIVDAPILHLITLQNLAYHYPNHNFPKAPAAARLRCAKVC